MNSRTTNKDEAWYRNGMVWLVLAIPALTVIGCLVTIYLAVSNPDYLVKEPEGTALSSGEIAEKGYD